MAILVGLAGIVIPVLPGSILIGGAIVLWAVLTGSPQAWIVVAVAVALLGAGAASTTVLTARRTKAAGVPNSSLVLAGLLGIVGFFVVPVIGLVLFFAGGLLGIEYWRLRDLATAWSTTWTALKAVGLAMLVELGAALLAAGTWLVAVLVWF